VFSGLTVAATGIVTTTSDLVVTTASGAVTTSVYAGNPQISGAGSLYVTASSGNLLLRSSGTIALLPGNSATGTVYLDASVNFFPNIAGTGNLGTTAKPWLTLTCGAITASGAITNSYTSLVSSPATVLTGTWFTGGTGTTTKPHVLIEPTGTTSTAWSTSGTGFGLNAPSGYAGNVVDLKINNSTVFSIGSSATTVGRGMLTNQRADLFNYRFSVQQFGAVIESGGYFGSAGSADSSASADCTLSRASAGVWQVGTTGQNASGSLNLTNLTASGTILTRNGTSPTSIQITNTYTSATSFGLLDIRANAAQTAYEISSFLGSAGGANLPINIGHRDSAGTFTSALSVATGTQSTLLTKDSHYITQTRQLASGRMGFRVTTGGSDVCFARYNDAGIIAELGSGHASGSTEIWAGNAARISIASTGSITFSGLIKPQQATTAAAPAYVLGAIYFDTTLNKLRIGGATAWETVTSV
jgi:hypothetical protein